MYEVSTVAARPRFATPGETITEVKRLLELHRKAPTPHLIEITGTARVAQSPVLTVVEAGSFAAAWWNRCLFAHARRWRSGTGTPALHLDGALVWVPLPALTLKRSDVVRLLKLFLAQSLARPDLPGLTWQEGVLVTRGPRRAWMPDIAGADANAWVVRTLAGRCTGLAHTFAADEGADPQAAAIELKELSIALEAQAVHLDARPLTVNSPPLPPVLPPLPPGAGALERIKIRSPVAADELRHFLTDVATYLDRCIAVGATSDHIEAINNAVNRLSVYPATLERRAAAL